MVQPPQGFEPFTAPVMGAESALSSSCICELSVLGMFPTINKASMASLVLLEVASVKNVPVSKF